MAASARRNWPAVTGYSYPHRAFDEPLSPGLGRAPTGERKDITAASRAGSPRLAAGQRALLTYARSSVRQLPKSYV